jgi:hypothetical protein
MAAGAEAGAVVVDAPVEGGVAASVEDAKVEVVVAVATRLVEEQRQEHSTELLLIGIIPRMNMQPSHRKTCSSSLTYEMQETPCTESVQLALFHLYKRGD